MELYGIILMSCYCLGVSQAQYATATCNMAPNPSLAPTDPLYQDITGTVDFIQQVIDGPVTMYIGLTGFNTTDGRTTHGFHVHEFGNIAGGCEDAGPHFNPYNNNHGGPNDTDRHVGDLGNIEEDVSGGVIQTRMDSVIKFDGTSDITGRTLDIHETFDDLGRGNHSDSPTSGHAGKRIACCIIGVTSHTSHGLGANAAVPLDSGLILKISILFLVVTSIFNCDMN